MSFASFPISAPVTFRNTAAGDEIVFNAVSGAGENDIYEFVTSAQGDLLYQACDSSGKLERLALGSTGEVLTISGTPVAQVVTLSTIPAEAAGSYDGSYFLISSPTVNYYVWFDLNNASTDPGTVVPTPADLFVGDTLRTGIEVNVSPADSANAVALAIRAAVIAEGGGLVFSAPAPGADTVVITNLVTGGAVAPADGTTSVGGTFAIAETTPGASACPVWGNVAPFTSSDVFMATVTASGTAVASGPGWVDLSSAVVTWDDTTAPNNDAGGLFTPASGLFTVPAGVSQIWQLSASVGFTGNAFGTGSITGRFAVRQARLFNVTTATQIAFVEAQTSPFTANPTVLRLQAANASLAASDTIRIEVRHDAPIALAILPDSTQFSAHLMSNV